MAVKAQIQLARTALDAEWDTSHSGSSGQNLPDFQLDEGDG